MRISHFPFVFIILCYSFWIHHTVYFTGVSGQIVEDQQQSLLKLKNSLRFEQEKSHKLWTGVTCDEEGHIIGLDLNGESINGGFDNSNLQMLVKNFTMIRQLYMDGVSVSAEGNEWSNALLQLHSLQDSCELTGMFPDKIFQLATLSDIDLSFNYDLNGSLPELPPNGSLQKLIVSHTRFSGALPASIGNLRQLSILDLSNCHFNGTLPSSMSGLKKLTSLLLSLNNFIGQIPSLNMSRNLTHLDLSSNHIRGSIPIWIWQLERNKFHGHIECPDANRTWPMLQIFDVAFNKFSGLLPGKCFKTWKAMKLDKYHHVSKFNHIGFTSVDFSSNNFDGTIPEELMEFTGLYALNLSHNCLTGQIPSSIGNLTQLESLDLSSNNLGGEIPTHLELLNFLSVLNLSSNRLVGKIPVGRQLQTFDQSSYTGNEDLCGSPLAKNCSDEIPGLSTSANARSHATGENIVRAELGFVLGLGLFIVPLLFWKNWRERYWKHVNSILCGIFPQLNLEYETRGGQSYQVLRWRP
ncbi:hypothetical protein V8G54_018104 [Vigna mungo]|uniref:Verticillium wilt resistance-like protein n=1 Tax=Vigna mungo TaxID=3915 RepID=A0AAQ3RTM0_VIGMU